jgi:signal transduction histidine kinase
MSPAVAVPHSALDDSTDATEARWPRRVERLMRQFPWIGAAVSVSIGAFTLLGWFLGRPDWTTVLPGLPPMEPNSAVMAILAGGSLVLLAPPGAPRPRVIVGRAIALAVLALASLTLIEHLFGIDFAIDRALVNPGESPFHAHPGRLSPQTAAAFAFVGAALVSLEATTKRKRRPASLLAVLAALIPLISMLAYMFGTAELFGAQALYPYIGMGVLTAVTLLSLGGGVVAARANEGLLSVLMRRDSGGLAARQLVTWLVFLALATCGIEAGARFGLYAAPIGSAGVVLLGIIGGSLFVLRVSHQLSRLDTEQRRRERDVELLSKVGGILTSSLDYEATLPVVAQLAAAGFADFSIVDLVDEKRTRQLVAIGREHLGPAPSVLGVSLNAHGKAVGTMSFARVSTSTPFDAQDERVAQDLAQRAALSIDNGRLYRAAQQAIRARDDLMGVVAHDLRNPLSVILMQAELLHMIHPNGEQQSDEAATAISRSATRMNRLIQDLLDVTRIDAGGLTIQLQPIDPAKLVADAVESQRPLATSDELELRSEIDTPLPEIEGDRDRLTQVFENLIGNAIKFTEAGGQITVGAKRDDERSDVLFWVSDAGVGIRAEDVPRVFDRFWQAEGESSAARGTGLGLPIVKGIVEAHGGRVWVESTIGRGTTVSFTIPAKR